MHAKLLLAQSNDSDHVLFGSTNCTVAALGRSGFRGLNEETSLYRKVAAGSICRELDLDKMIDDSLVVSSADMPAYSAANDLQHDEFVERNPGSFELFYDNLIWRPSTRENPLHATDDLCKCVYKLTALAPEDRNDERLRHVLERLGEKFAKRLGLDNDSILKSHLEYLIVHG